MQLDKLYPWKRVVASIASMSHPEVICTVLLAWAWPDRDAQPGIAVNLTFGNRKSDQIISTICPGRIRPLPVLTVAELATPLILLHIDV